MHIDVSGPLYDALYTLKDIFTQKLLLESHNKTVLS